MLLEQFLVKYRRVSRENKKYLLQHLINQITIKQLKEKSRADNEPILSIPASNDRLPPYLQRFLPLFMIRFTKKYGMMQILLTMQQMCPAVKHLDSQHHPQLL